MKATPEKLSAFLHVLSETCNVGAACAAIDINRKTAYRWRESKPDFAREWDEAVKIGLTACEDEVQRRAVEGVDEPVFYQGAECGTVRKYSDTLLMFFLKGHMPEKYRDSSRVEMAGGTKNEIKIVSEFDGCDLV